MTPEAVVELVRQALVTAFWMAAPLLAIGFVAGIAVSLVQIATSMQDNAFSTIPRLVAFLAGLLFLMPWMLHKTMDYTTSLFGQPGALCPLSWPSPAGIPIAFPAAGSGAGVGCDGSPFRCLVRAGTPGPARIVLALGFTLALAGRIWPRQVDVTNTSLCGRLKLPGLGGRGSCHRDHDRRGGGGGARITGVRGAGAEPAGGIWLCLRGGSRHPGGFRHSVGAGAANGRPAVLCPGAGPGSPEAFRVKPRAHPRGNLCFRPARRRKSWCGWRAGFFSVGVRIWRCRSSHC